VTLLDKLVSLRSKEAALLDAICHLAREDPYVKVLTEIEAWESVPADKPKSPEAGVLWEFLKQSPSLLRLMKTPPWLSKADPQAVIAMAGLSDLSPDRGRMFRTADAVFMRLLDLSKSGAMSIPKLIQDDFCQLALLTLYFPGLAGKLGGIAAGEHWMRDMTGVEKRLGGDLTVTLSALADDLAKAVEAEPVGIDDVSPAGIFTGPLRFSSMPAEEVLAYAAIHPSLPHPLNLIAPTFTPSPAPVEKGRALAKAAFDKLNDSDRRIIERSYTWRQDCLAELKTLRAFVKRDVLQHRWPDLYDRLRRDQNGFVQFENQMLDPNSCTEEEREHLKPYLADDGLVQVLQLQPHFRDLLGIATDAAPVITSAIASVAVTPPGETARPQVAAAAAPMAEPTRVEYVDASVALREGAPNAYFVEMTVGGSTVVSRELAPFRWEEIRARVNALRFTRDLPAIGSNSAAVPVRELAPTPPPDYTSQLKALGLDLYDRLFRGEVRRFFLKTLADSQNLRIHWDGDALDPRSAVIPWECLFVPNAPVSFLALTRKYSLTRRNAAAESTEVAPIAGALRILFVSATPASLPPLPFVEVELEVLSKVVERAGPRVELRVLKNVNLELLTDTLREFRPHLFHFSGHGVYRPDTATGELVFEESPRADGGQTTPRLIAADRFAVLLHDYDVFLAVMNACDTGVSSMNDAVSSVAGALVKAGVPAVVATMRAVADEAATLFTREFYRSFLAGFTVEGSIAEARKILNSEYWDWSAYALFVGSTNLNSLRVLPSLRGESAK